MFTAADCKRLTGTDQPTYYTTPPDTNGCKNLVLDGPTPCWHPHCDCFDQPRRRALFWEGFLLGLAAPGVFLGNLFRRR